MIYTEKTKKAMKLCFEAHKEQVDKTGLPYVFHPFHLAEQMEDEVTTVVALLHDVAEDTDITLCDMAAMGFGENSLRLPLTPMEEKNEAVLLDLMKEQGLI